MTDTSAGKAQENLGAGALIGESFAILFGSFAQLLVLAFIPALIIVMIQTTVLTGGLSEFSTGILFAYPWASIILIMAVTLIGSTLVTALVVRMAYDVKTEHAMRMGEYAKSALVVIVPLVLCSIGATIAVVFGFMLLIVPGVMLLVMWAVYAPVIVIERAGFGCFVRSAELTKGYRWPVFGAFILMFLCLIVVGIAVEAFNFLLPATAGIGPARIALETVSSGLSMAFSGIFYSLLYARLREIKEGIGVEDLAEIFA